MVSKASISMSTVMGEIGNVGQTSSISIRSHCTFNVARLGGENVSEEGGKQMNVRFDFLRVFKEGDHSAVAHILNTEHDPNGIIKTRRNLKVIE